MGPDEDFDFNGRFFKLAKVRAKPKPFGGTRPVIMSAGASPAGLAFAVRNCDAFFMQASRVSVAETAQRVAEVKALAAQQGRDISVFTVGVIVCRPTMQDAEAYHHHCVVEQADWSAVDKLLALRGITPATVPPDEFLLRRREFAHGNSGLPIVGDPDHVAQALMALSGAGLSGIAVSLVNFADELPYLRAEVLPRLERAGLRLPA